jgi:ATP-dependent Clp protease ATP-binding subunit ClpA
MVRTMDRLTERGVLAVLFARKEAETGGAPAVSTLHLLVGLICEDEGRAAELLATHGVRLEDVRPLAGGRSGTRFVPGAGEAHDLPLSPTAQRALERAVEEARWLGLDHAATEHLLLGLLHEADGTAIRLLLDAGVSETAIREDLVRRAPMSPPPRPATAPGPSEPLVDSFGLASRRPTFIQSGPSAEYEDGRRGTQ